MQFNKHEAIYLQIADEITNKILRKELLASDKIPSVRELAFDLEVNPNTVMRTYSYLEERGIIYNQRGIGYFVTENAYRQVQKIKMNSFIDSELPRVFKKMELLEVSITDLKELFHKYKKQIPRENL